MEKGNGVGPVQRTEMEAQISVSYQRSAVGHTDGEIGGRGKRLAQNRPRKEDVVRSLLDSVKQTVEKKAETKGGQADKETKRRATICT